MVEIHPGNGGELRVLAPVGDVLTDVGGVILRGCVQPGVAAPDESELSRSLRVSRSSARRALTTLEGAGLLVPEDVTGAKPPRRVLAGTATGDISRLLRFLLIDIAGVGQTDLLGIRTTLEREAAAGAARVADEADVADLATIVEQMREPAVTPTAFERLDRDLHLRIARASGNALHEPLLAGIGDAIAGQMRRAFAAVPDWPVTARRLASEHWRLVEFIGGRRAADAADYVESHVQDFYTRG